MKINSRQILALVIFTAFQAAGASARSSVPASNRFQANCPRTRVQCSDSVFVNEKIRFTAEVSGGDQNVTPTYNWTVSAGAIESGQGTSTIEVSTSGLEGDSTVTATVDVGGFDRSCGYGSTASSCTTSVLKKAEARKVDEYGKLAPKDENARLDNFALVLLQDPTAKGYIIVYDGQASLPGSAKRAAVRTRTYLVTQRKLDPDRVVTIEGGQRETPAFELWIAPSGAEPPTPMPTVRPAAKPRAKGKP